MKSGIELLNEELGNGPTVERHKYYKFRLRMWLRRGDAIRWSEPWGLLDRARLEDDGTALITDLRVDREYMFSGLFYGIQGMRVGGIRTLRIAPHLAYREAGVQGVIPPNALLTVEVQVVEERQEAS